MDADHPEGRHLRGLTDRPDGAGPDGTGAGAARSLWRDAVAGRPGRGAVRVIDQRRLPHRVEVLTLKTAADAVDAIRDMAVRGAPLIGVTAAYGVALAMAEDGSDEGLASICRTLAATRPTAVNLAWALRRMQDRLVALSPAERPAAAFDAADRLADEDAAVCAAIGDHGAGWLRRHHAGLRTERPLQVLTHCNAGRLAAVAWGTALAPIYRAHRDGLPLHVWVDETRPRNQGASLTAWELAQAGIAHTIVVDNAGGHLMQRGRVDVCLVGADRVTRTGDVCNKIGTYLKALAAADNAVPFLVALPSSTIDWALTDGLAQIPIEIRSAAEVTGMTGLANDGTLTTVRLAPAGSPAENPAFDVTPARLVTALVTERGVCAATEAGLNALFPERTACTS